MAKKIKAKKAAKKVAAKKKAVAKKPLKAKKKAAPKPVKKVEVKKPKVIKPKKAIILVPKNDATKQYSQSELFDCLVSYCGFVNRKEARLFYDGFCSMVQESLKSGYRLLLPGLGKIQVRKTAARMGINPLTKEPIKIEARKRVRFTPAKVLKEAVL